MTANNEGRNERGRAAMTTDTVQSQVDVTITLPQSVWQAVEDALVTQVAEVSAIPGDVDDSIVLLEQAISALKGTDDGT